MPEVKYIWNVTRGVRELAEERPALLGKLIKAFSEEVRARQDWFYEIVIDGQRFFVVDKGEYGYTAMLPKEY